MKVITSGNDIRQRVHATCARCSAVVEVERGDVHEMGAALGLGFVMHVWFCPECGKENPAELSPVWK